LLEAQARTPHGATLSRFLATLLALALPAFALADAPASNSLDLEACRRTAREAHPRLAAARAQAAAASARRSLALAGFLPSLAAEGSFSASRGATSASGAARLPASMDATTGVFGPAEVESWGTALTLRQTLWDFGRTWHAAGAAAATEEAALADSRALLETLDVEAEAAYRTALAADELVAAMTEARVRAASHLERARARAEVGLRPRYDVTRAEVELANAELALVSAQNARELSRAQLANACGLARLPADVTLPPPPPRALIALPSLEQALDEALARRPELEAAQARVDAADQSDSATRALYLPSVSATGTVALRSRGLAELASGWRGGVQVNVPLLAGGADEAGVREAEANLSVARANLENTTRAVRLEIETALLSAREAAARLSASEALERSTQEGLKLAEARYETGAGDALELADAQVAFASARATRVRAGLDAAVSAARLERVLGRREAPR